MSFRRFISDILSGGRPEMDSASALAPPTLNLRVFWLFGLPLALLLFVLSQYMLDHGKWLWDFHVYQGAAKAWIQGLNAYDDTVIARLSGTSGLYFIYPPHMLVVLGHLPWLLTTEAGELAYLAIFTLSIAFVIILQMEWLMPRHWARLPAALLLFFFLFKAGALAAQTGNIAIPAYALCFAAMFYALRRGQWIWFCLAVALFAQMKPHILILLLLPLYFDGRQIWKTILIGLLAIVPYLFDWLFLHDQFIAFMAASQAQLTNASDWGLSGLGLLSFFSGHFAVIYHFVNNSVLPQRAIFGLCAALFFLVLLATGWRMRDLRLLGRLTMPRNVQAAWAILAIFTANPRLKEYDLCMAAIPFAVVAGYTATHSRRGLAIIGVGYVLSSCSPVETHAFIMCVALSLAGLAAATEPAVTILKTGQAR